MKKMITMMALVAATSVSANETVIDFKCTEIGLTHLFQFKMEGRVRLWQSLEDRAEQKVYRINGLKAEVRDAGNNSSFKTVEFGRMQGEVKYINDPNWTLNPFTAVSLKPSRQNTEKEVAFAQFNLDYPGKLNSKIRMKDGKTYRAECTTVAVNSCIFGDDIGHDENLFDVQDLEVLYTDSRIDEGDADFVPGQTIHVEKTRVIYKPTGAIYTQYTTFEDEWDGGNTIGWIEDSEGNHVANIGDSEIYSCSAFE